MKKLYILTFIAAISALNIFGQIYNGLTGYTVVTVGGTPIATSQNILNRSAFVIDNTGNKWIGFNSGNINSFQLIRFNGTQWDSFPAFKAILPNNKVNALAVDASNNLWIGSNAGLTKYDGSSFTTYNTSSSGIVSDTVISLACGNNNVYVGTNHGLSIYNGSTFTNYNTSNGMNSNIVNCITVENTSAIWLGNPNGLDKFNGSSFTFNYVTVNNTAEVVNCIYIDAQNNKWLGTNTHGAIKYDNTTFYTMQQLYPGNTTQEVLGVGNFNWAYPIKTMCKGPNGGVLFCIPGQIPPSGSGRIQTSYFSCEVTNTQLYSYLVNMAATTSSTGDYGILQHDVGSNKIFFTQTGNYPLSTFLYSFDTSLYSSTYQFDISTTNSAFLDINDVTALITDNSQQHWDATSGKSKYFSNKQNDQSPLFNSALWIGGFANSTNLRIAAMTYRQTGVDFWPGPLNAADSALTDNATSLAYDKVWKVNRFDIANFIYNWNVGNVQNGSYSVPASIVTWPGNSPYPGQTLAPFVDYNSDGIYNCMQGDYPLIKGDQMIWSVYNDNANKHSETVSIHNIGIEVHASAYAYTCPSIADSNVVLNNTTFYNYQIYNRSQNQITQTYIGLWEDTDLGNYADDYIGCDVSNDFGYTYNGDGYDEDTYEGTGYHHNLPVFACNILSGPFADAGDGIDNNHNCIIDEAGEKCMMSGFSSYNNTSDNRNGNPGTFNGTGPMGYYNLLRSVWEDGAQSISYGNLGLNAISASAPACKYLFPGNTDPYGFGLGGNCSSPIAAPTTLPWTEGNVSGNNPGDRRMMVNVGPFTMQPGGMYELYYALVFTQDSATCDSNSTCLIARATQDNNRVKHWFNTNTYPSCLSLVGVGIKQNITPQLNLKLYPNPANTNVYIELGTSQKNVTIEIFDMLGGLVRGYQYAELDKYATIPVSDLQSGVYMVKVKSADGFAITKFVKE